MKKAIATNNAPGAIGPYSQAIAANGFLFISGQMPVNPATGNVVDGGITEQTEMVMKNLKAILKEAGCTFDNVVKSTCYLSDIANFGAMNAVYGNISNKTRQRVPLLQSAHCLKRSWWRLK